METGEQMYHLLAQFGTVSCCVLLTALMIVIGVAAIALVVLIIARTIDEF